jgi:hypothetical protein
VTNSEPSVEKTDKSAAAAPGDAKKTHVDKIDEKTNVTDVDAAKPKALRTINSPTNLLLAIPASLKQRKPRQPRRSSQATFLTLPGKETEAQEQRVHQRFSQSFGGGGKKGQGS